VKGWKSGSLRPLVVPIALITFLLSAAHVRADLLCVNVAHGPNRAEEFRTSDFCRNEQHPQIDGKKILEGMRHEWQSMREEMARGIVEATLTMFFIKSNPPPKGKPPPGKTNPPPPTGSGNNPPPPPPPPPEGQGEPPTNIPPPPTSSSPEPTSFALGVFSAGFVSYYGWRRRRKSA